MCTKRPQAVFDFIQYRDPVACPQLNCPCEIYLYGPVAANWPQTLEHFYPKRDLDVQNKLNKCNTFNVIISILKRILKSSTSKNGQ